MVVETGCTMSPATDGRLEEFDVHRDDKSTQNTQLRGEDGSGDQITQAIEAIQRHRRHNEIDSAENLAQQTLETARRTKGERHPDTLTVMNCLSSIYFSRGRRRSAESLAKAVLTNSHGIAPSPTSEKIVVDAIRGRARVLEKDGQLAEALKLRRECLSRTPPDAPDYPIVLYSLACVLYKMEFYEEALCYDRAYLAATQNARDPTKLDTISAMYRVADDLRGLGRLQEVAEVEREVVRRRQVAHGEASEYTLESMERLAKTLMTIGDANAIQKLLKRMEKGWEQHRTNNPDMVDDAQQRIGGLKKELGEILPPTTHVSFSTRMQGFAQRFLTGGEDRAPLETQPLLAHRDVNEKELKDVPEYTTHKPTEKDLPERKIEYDGQ